jgi:uncharacterized membrane protein YhhN
MIKTGAVGLLGVWAALSGAPYLLILALALSAIGDAFLAGDPKRFLLPGMAAFLAAHLAYIALFAGLAPAPFTAATGFVFAALLTPGAWLIAHLWKDFGEMRWPVIAYTLVIAGMGAVATRLPGQMWPVMLGAALFIASDAVLSFNLFKLKEGSPAHAITSRLLWALYYGGQALIAYGLLTKL